MTWKDSYKHDKYIYYKHFTFKHNNGEIINWFELEENRVLVF